MKVDIIEIFKYMSILIQRYLNIYLYIEIFKYIYICTCAYTDILKNIRHNIFERAREWNEERLINLVQHIFRTKMVKGQKSQLIEECHNTEDPKGYGIGSPLFGE